VGRRHLGPARACRGAVLWPACAPGWRGAQLRRPRVQMRFKTEFGDRDDTTEQICGSKRLISKFRYRDVTTQQV
jgi:hypothetical protein